MAEAIRLLCPPMTPVKKMSWDCLEWDLLFRSESCDSWIRSTYLLVGFLLFLLGSVLLICYALLMIAMCKVWNLFNMVPFIACWDTIVRVERPSSWHPWDQTATKRSSNQSSNTGGEQPMYGTDSLPAVLRHPTLAVIPIGHLHSFGLDCGWLELHLTSPLFTRVILSAYWTGGIGVIQ